MIATVTPHRGRLLSSIEIDEDQTSSLARCLAAAVFISPWVWVIAFGIAYNWAVDDIATRHKHVRDMPMGAAIHAFGFFIMSLPATHIIGACVFAPIVASPYLRHGVSIIPLCSFGVGLGIASGRLAAASMNAPAGPDYDVVVRAFVFASICFTAAFFVMTRAKFWSICWTLLRYTGIGTLRLVKGVTMRFTEVPHRAFSNGDHNGGTR